MDPDIPMPSIESDPATQTLPASVHSPDTGNTPFQSMSPEKTPYKTPASQPTSPAPLKIPKSSSNSRSNTPIREKQTTPALHSKRSHPNLGASRNTTPSRQLLRRTSSNLNPASPGASRSNNALPEMPPQPPSLTASAVAKEYFERELDLHGRIDCKVAVFIHDSCFGHRFSRPKTSKAALSTIVERPERLLATLLGAATAYVRLGRRHGSSSSSPHPNRDPSTSSRPPFIIRKTRRAVALNDPAVTAVHGNKWMEELQIMCDSAESKLAMNGKELTRPIGYGKDEAGNALPKLHEGDLYLCSESLAALQGCLGGVCDAVDAVFSADATCRAFVNIRPPGHHCSSDYPSGFCWLNNVHVGISYAAMNHGLTHAAIIDFDLHHGDGSQTITWDHNQKALNLPKNAAAHRKTPIGYYSLHDINSYPCEWGDEDKVRNASLCLQNAHGQSIWNVHLEPWSSLADFWQLYESKYKVLLQKTREFLIHHNENLKRGGIIPKAAIFLSAGFDACQWESAGMQRHKVNVPTDFYARFTQDIVKLSEEEGLGVDGRVISVLEGGYSDRALTSGVLSHLCGLSAISEIREIARPTLSDVAGSYDPIPVNEEEYSALWWSESQLEELEAMVEGRAPPPIKKAVKSNGNYSSPTQASTLKMTEDARERHSLSSQMRARLSLASMTPDPPPEVDWVTASYELSRALIPSDRSTLSCRHDELNAEATKARRMRQSMLTLPTQPEEKMQLRGRKPKVAGPVSSRADRRTTIAAVHELPDPSRSDFLESERPRRRSSAASSILSSFQDMKLNDFTTAHADGVLPLDTNPAARPVALVQEAADDRQAGPNSGPSPRRTRSQSRERNMQESILTLKATADEHSQADAKMHDDSTNTRSSPLSRQSSLGGSRETKDGMDELTNGMKKVSIKLKMPTQEQHDANQKKAEELSTRTSKAVRKPAIPRATKVKMGPPAPKPPKAPAKPRKGVQSAVSAKAPHPVQAPEKASGKTGLSTPVTVNTGAADTAVNGTEASSGTSNDAPTLEGTAPAAMTIGIDVQDEATSFVPPRPAAPTPATMLQSKTSTPRKTKADLPVFTSRTPIPFSRMAHPALERKIEEKEKSIWDVPETPR